MGDKLFIQTDRNLKKGGPMLNRDLDLDTLVAAKTPQLTVPPPRLAPGRFLAPLSPAIASWHRRPHQGGSQVIIRFKNGYGAIISEYRRSAGIYEVAPLRFNGPGPDDYEFYFRSHVPDLTWCSESDEMVKVCEQIARLLPPGMG
jgi:hypothetical protein